MRGRREESQSLLCFLVWEVLGGRRHLGRCEDRPACAVMT